jgi:hypothetical protein
LISNLKKRLTGTAAAAALVVAGLIGAASPAAAGVSLEGNGCRYAPVHADGLYVLPCLVVTGPFSMAGQVTISGSNQTYVTLCEQLLGVNPDGSTFIHSGVNCKTAWGPGDTLYIDWGSLQWDTYVIHAWFTSPTYWDGGESARGRIFS